MEHKTNMTKNTTPNRLIYKILFVVFLLIFLIATGIMFRDWYIDWQEQKELDELSSMSTESELEEDNQGNGTQTDTESHPDVDELEVLGIPIIEKEIDWAGLQAKNEDIYAWIYIPGTEVDYPILQHPTDDYYYQDHNSNGKKSAKGCIFSQAMNSKDFTDYNTILYGHNATNKSMFSTLHEYENGAFFDEYKYVYIYTPETMLVYEIVAAYESNDRHIWYSYDFGVEEGYQEYIDTIMSIRDMKANIRKDAKVTTDAPMLTMSTCMDSDTNSSRRYIVNAILRNLSALVEE